MLNGNDFYKELIDNLSDGVYFVDRDRVIQYWNKGAERITGYNAKEVVGHSCRDNLPNHVSAQDEKSLATTISIGATILLPKDTPETFVRRADHLMYQSRQAAIAFTWDK